MDRRDAHRALPHRGCDALDRPVTDITGREDARDARLQGHRGPRGPHDVDACEDVSALITLELAGQSRCPWVRSDLHEQAVHQHLLSRARGPIPEHEALEVTHAVPTHDGNVEP